MNLRVPKVPKDQKWPVTQTGHWDKQILMRKVNTAEYPGSKKDVFILSGRSRATHEIMVKTESLILHVQLKISMLAFLRLLNAMWLLTHLKHNCQLQSVMMLSNSINWI